MSFEVGMVVEVPATYAKGPFSNEMLVSIDTGDGRISGFVRRENIKFIDDTHAAVKAKVLDNGPPVLLELYGQFFTTNGIEPVQADWAVKNLRRAEAA